MDPLFMECLTNLKEAIENPKAVRDDDKALLRLVALIVKPPTSTEYPSLECDPRRHLLLRHAIRQPHAVYCDDASQSAAGGFCCYTHIAERRPISDWEWSSAALEAGLLKAVASGPAAERTPQQVLDFMRANTANKSAEWNEVFGWIQVALPIAHQCLVDRTYTDTYTSQNSRGVMLPQDLRHSEIIGDVIDAGLQFFNAFNTGKPISKRRCLHAGQVVSILVHLYCAKRGFKELIEMKTGEGKTNVCGISAAMVAKHFKGFCFVLTSSQDHALNDKKSTTEFIKAYLGQEPCLISELDSVLAASLDPKMQEDEALLPPQGSGVSNG